MEKNILLVIGALLLARHFYFQDEEPEVTKDSEIASTNKIDSGVPVVSISFCQSWSYGGRFRQFQKVIQDKYGIAVLGKHHLPSSSKLLLINVLTYTQYALLGLIFFGDKVFEATGIAPPGIYRQARDNKVWSAFLIFMIGNQIIGGCQTTGAFEVELGTLESKCVENGKIMCGDFYKSDLIFSKIKQQRFPEFDDIIPAIGETVNQLKRQKKQDEEKLLSSWGLFWFIHYNPFLKTFLWTTLSDF